MNHQNDIMRDQISNKMELIACLRVLCSKLMFTFFFSGILWIETFAIDAERKYFQVGCFRKVMRLFCFVKIINYKMKAIFRIPIRK